MPHITKQIVRELIETLDACGVGAHHPDLLALLDQPEGEPVGHLFPSTGGATVFAGWDTMCKMPAGTKFYTHPLAHLKMLDDDEFNEVSCHIPTGKDAIKAFCAKHNLTLEKL